MAENSSIQEHINFNLSAAGDRTMVIRVENKSGSCVIPKNVHVRFIKCTIDSISAPEGYNNLYFKNCTVNGSVVLKDGTFLIEDSSTINGVTNFSGSKGEIIKSAINNVIILDNNATLKSRKNFYANSSARLEVNNYSKCESVLDNYTYTDKVLFQLKNFSYLKLSKPSLNVKSNVFLADNHCVINVQNCDTFSSQTVGTFKNNSKLVFSNTKNFLSTEGISADNSVIYLSNITNLAVTNNLFKGQHSDYTCTNVANIQTIGSPIDIKNSSCHINNFSSILGGELFAQVEKSTFSIQNKDKGTSSIQGNRLVKTVSNEISKISFSNIKSIENKGTSPIFEILYTILRIDNVDTITSNGKVAKSDVSKLLVTNCINLTSKSSCFALANKSLLLVDKVDNITSFDTDAFYLFDSKVTITNSKALNSTNGSVFSVNSNSQANISKVEKIQSSGKSAILLNYKSSLGLSNITEIIGGMDGIDASSNEGSIHITAVTSIVGVSGNGITAGGCNVTIDFLSKDGASHSTIKGANGISFFATNTGVPVLSLSNGGEVIGNNTSLNINKGILNCSNVKFTGPVKVNNSVINGQVIKCSAALTLEHNSFVTMDKSELETANVNDSHLTANVLKSSSINLQQGTLLSARNSISSLSASNSFAGLFGTKLLSSSSTGNSTSLFGAVLSSLTHSSTEDGSFTDFVGGIFNEGKNFVLQANKKIQIKSKDYEAYFRAMSTTEAVTMDKTTVGSTDGSSTITTYPAQIILKAASVQTITP